EGHEFVQVIDRQLSKNQAFGLDHHSPASLTAPQGAPARAIWRRSRQEPRSNAIVRHPTPDDPSQHSPSAAGRSLRKRGRFDIRAVRWLSPDTPTYSSPRCRLCCRLATPSKSRVKSCGCSSLTEAWRGLAHIGWPATLFLTPR